MAEIFKRPIDEKGVPIEVYLDHDHEEAAKVLRGKGVTFHNLGMYAQTTEGLGGAPDAH